MPGRTSQGDLSRTRGARTYGLSVGTTDDTRRFDALFRAHAADVRAYAARRVGADAADEIVAETFLVAWRRLDDIPAGQQAAWLYGVARRQLANHVRGERRRDALVDRIVALAPPVPETPAQADGDPVVLRALAELRPADRELLCLVAWEGLTHEELAVALGVGRVVLRTRLGRARRRMAAALERNGAHDLPTAFTRPGRQIP